jgi:hypothetical protein
MTSPYTFTLIAIAAIVWNLAAHLPQARMWIVAGAMSFFASTIYVDAGLPYHPAFTLVCDACVCLSVYFLGKEEWEKRIYNVFQLSVLISIIRMSKLIDDSVVYAAALEICNLMALLFIGGTAIIDRISANGHGYGLSAWWHRHIRVAHLSLRKARSADPFHKVRR